MIETERERESKVRVFITCEKVFVLLHSDLAHFLYRRTPIQIFLHALQLHRVTKIQRQERQKVFTLYPQVIHHSMILKGDGKIKVMGRGRTV